jgi:hypothetical protein
MLVECQVARKLKVPSEEAGGSPLQGETGLSGLPIDEKISQRDLQRLLELSTISNGSTPDKAIRHEDLSSGLLSVPARLAVPSCHRG